MTQGGPHVFCPSLKNSDKLQTTNAILFQPNQNVSGRMSFTHLRCCGFWHSLCFDSECGWKLEMTVDSAANTILIKRYYPFLSPSIATHFLTKFETQPCTVVCTSSEMQLQYTSGLQGCVETERIVTDLLELLCLPPHKHISSASGVG